MLISDLELMLKILRNLCDTKIQQIHLPQRFSPNNSEYLNTLPHSLWMVRAKSSKPLVILWMGVTLPSL